MLVDKTLYLSGQIGIDVATGAIVTGGIEAETNVAIKNLGEVLRWAQRKITDSSVISHFCSVLRASGAGFNSVVKVTVYLKDLRDYEIFNKVYATYFPSPTEPARSVIEVAALPLGELHFLTFLPFREYIAIFRGPD